MRRWLLALATLAACSCGSLPTAETSPSGSGARTASPAATSKSSATPATPTTSSVLAVVSGAGGAISLMGSDGRVVATATAQPAPLRPNAQMSWTSASVTRLYYLNGGSEVRFLAPDGTTGTATRIQVQANQEAGFAVSPEDKRIAVSIFTYTLPPANAQGFAQPTYNGMHMYVEDLLGGGHHVEIFSSATVAEFPIGWTGGQLVVAVSTPLCCHAIPINPYAASSYHMADPTTGNRLASLCESSYGPSGPVEPIGTMCIQYQGGPTFQRWDGSPFMPPTAVPTSDYLVALSPDGKRVAVGGSPIHVIHLGIDDALPVSGYSLGWLDANHIVFQSEGAKSLSIFDLQTQTKTDLPGATNYLGTFPAALA